MTYFAFSKAEIIAFEVSTSEKRKRLIYYDFRHRKLERDNIIRCYGRYERQLDIVWLFAYVWQSSWHRTLFQHSYNVIWTTWTLPSRFVQAQPRPRLKLYFTLLMDAREYPRTGWFWLFERTAMLWFRNARPNEMKSDVFNIIFLAFENQTMPE